MNEQTNKQSKYTTAQPLSRKQCLLTAKLLAMIAVITPVQPYASSSETMQSSTSPSPGPPGNRKQFCSENSAQQTSIQAKTLTQQHPVVQNKTGKE